MGSQEEYALPELYVEDASGEPCASVDLERGTFEIGKGELCKVLYEEGWGRTIDPEGRVLRSFLVVKGEGGFFVREGSRVRLFEVGGSATRLVKREGERVKEGEVIAQVASRKGELRSIRSDAKGFVVYLAWLPGKPERYVYAVSEAAQLLAKIG